MFFIPPTLENEMPQKIKREEESCTITADVDLWDIFNFTSNAVILDPSFNITLNINCRAVFQIHT